MAIVVPVEAMLHLAFLVTTPCRSSQCMQFLPSSSHDLVDVTATLTIPLAVDLDDETAKELGLFFPTIAFERDSLSGQ